MGKNPLRAGGHLSLWTVNRSKLVDMMTPLYYARVASFVRQSRDMSSREAEELVEEQRFDLKSKRISSLKSGMKNPRRP